MESSATDTKGWPTFWIAVLVMVSAFGALSWFALHRDDYVTPAGRNPLSLRAGQPVSYLLLETQDADIADGSGPAIRRRSLRVIVPVGISRADLDATLRQVMAVERRKAAAADQIEVLAYGPNDNTKGPFTYGRADWARGSGDNYSVEISPGVGDKN